MSKKIKGLVLITGTTSGVGLNTLKPLLRFGWEVIAVNRSNKRAIKIAEEFLTKEEFKNVHFIEIDLSNLDDVRKGCDEILERFKTVSYTHLRAHETQYHLVCRLLLEKRRNSKCSLYRNRSFKPR